MKINNKYVLVIVVSLLLLSVIVYTKKRPDKPPPEITTEQAIISRVSTSEFGDLTTIKKRRILRVLVEYGKTNFFFDGPEPRGFDYEVMREYEKFLNQNINNESDKVLLTFIVRPFSTILDELVAGRGDIAVANFTITPEREKRVQFSDPYFSNVNEIIVHHKTVTDIKSIADLSNKSLHLLAEGSFIPHLAQINKQLKSKILPSIKVIEADVDFSAEDILEMVNANVYPITIADDFTAKTWKTVLPNIIVREDLQINKGGRIAWAIRQKSPELLTSLNLFIKSIRKGTLLGNIFFKRYFESSKWIENPTSALEVSKLEKNKPYFIKYANEYNFDWLSIAAIAYQESKIDQSMVSPSGAVGIMQIKPTTARSKPVSISDVNNPENNIRAGTKYLAHLRDHYFTSPDIAPEDRIDFTLAAYNAGPTRINRLRRLAIEHGYDSNKWFSNVERLVAREIGRETVRYVANINKYYIAYKMSEGNL